MKKTICVIILLVIVMTSLFVVNVSADSSEQITYFGTVVPCEKDNGYVPKLESNESEKELWKKLAFGGVLSLVFNQDDPHNGWSLGSFYVSGYSGVTKSDINSYEDTVPVYLKNAGDTISFGFKLDQDINKLNDNEKLSISDDRKVVQDCWVQDPYFKGDLGRGMLMIVHTNYKGEQTTTTYTDFLLGKSVGANTEVQLFEEGDYRVVLCYEIYKRSGWNWATDWLDPDGSWFNYRIESYFSVRNGNAMVFPFDIDTGAEVPNNGIVSNGFTVDLANSHYLHVFAKKENLSTNGTSLSEDTRFNKIVADNTVFDQEGKYTISVVNQYTGMTTEKVIYVGDNAVMKCHVLNGLTIEQINGFLVQGYTIGEDGTLIAPASEETETSGAGAATNDQSGTQSSGCASAVSPETGVVLLLTMLAMGVGVTLARQKGKER